MAPVEVIDLTSSPEPEDTPARAAALSRFQPRKEKIGLGKGLGDISPIPTIPVNGLPGFYGDDPRRIEDLHPTGTTHRVNAAPAGSFAPAAPGGVVNKHAKQAGAALPYSQANGQQPRPPATAPGANGISNGAPAVSRKSDATTRPGPPLNRPSLSKEKQPQAGPSNGHPRLPATGDGHQSVTGAQLGIPMNGHSRDSASAYQSVVNIARPMDGISPEARRRLYDQREAFVGTPLELAIQQDMLKTRPSQSGPASKPVPELGAQRHPPADEIRYPCPLAEQVGCSDKLTTLGHAARHAHTHAGRKNELCPICSKAFKHRDNMEQHHKRCEYRRTRDLTSQSTAPTLQPGPALGAPGVDPLKPDHSKEDTADKPFNSLKRSPPISPVSHHGGSDGTAKRPRIDLVTPEPQEMPSSKLRLVDTTDAEMEDLVLMDGSVNLPPDTTQSEIQSNSREQAPAADALPMEDLSGGPNRNGLPYSAEEDALLKKLRQVYRLPWPVITSRFSGRTQGSLTVRENSLRNREGGPVQRRAARSDPLQLRSHVPSKRIRKTIVASGMVPWASVKKARMEETQTVEVRREKRRRKRLREQRFEELDVESQSTQESSSEDEDTSDSSPKDSAYPSSMSRILRLRELGVNGRRAWSANPHSVSDELKDHVFSDYGLQRDYQGASGDVISLAWNDRGRFAAGSVAITDQQSMQYNMHRNLLVGDTKRGEIEELLQHHIPRPVIESTANINSNHAMRESQDPRLFPSVVAARFCPQNSSRLFTASMDKTLRHFTVGEEQLTHRYAINHEAPVSLLSVGGGHGLVASGCYQPTRNINVFKCGTEHSEVKMQLSSRQSIVPIFPSALKWGAAPQHRNFLLAGFSSEEDVVSTATGETCLWDASTGQQIHLGGVTRNVFDVAWNPIPSSSSIAFAVAGNANGHVVDKGMRSVIQCFAAGQRGGRGVLDWQCPALDINDLVFCPYDDNLIAAGATNGRVYIWDKRSADRNQRPLHTLKHGESLNVLDHDRDAEVADTGVQFLAWGPTKNRLYSGSSDGIVKIWNPYRSPSNAHVGDISGTDRDRVAIMSGAFSPDFQELLIGTENGRINLFKSGSGAVHHKPAQFKLRSAPEPEKEQEEPFIAARSLLETGQVEVRPCGGMPFRQAVQGPNYQGPFLEPSPKQWEEAQQRLESARFAQARKGHDNDAAGFSKAAANVQSAMENLEDLQRRGERALMAIPKAEAFQRELLELEKSRRELEALVGKVERCKLDCTVLPPPPGDDDEGVDDSGRSDLRIPGLLRYNVNPAVGMEGDEVPTLVPGCTPEQQRKRMLKGNRVKCFCMACVFKRAQMTSACSSCGKPAQPEIEVGKVTICERCAFGCFRCGMAVVIGRDCKLVRCVPCGLKWEIGALGYDLVGSSSSVGDDRMEITKDELDGDDWAEEIGEGDREFYAGRWSV